MFKAMLSREGGVLMSRVCGYLREDHIELDCMEAI